MVPQGRNGSRAERRRLAPARRTLGYERVHDYSPLLGCADPSVARDLVGLLPRDRRLDVPLYGGRVDDGLAYDAVVGRPGAFDRLERAQENLRPCWRGTS